jgi:serine/threonine-protein kinase
MSVAQPLESRSSYNFAQPPVAPVAPFANSPLPLANEFGDRGSFTGSYRMPVTPEERQRWDAIPVREFRRKLAPYLYVNAVIVLLSAFGIKNLFGITVMWTIYMAWKYAKLWSNGYDWRDVFHQQRHVELVDVVEDSVGYMKAMFDKNERKRMRDERVSRAIQARTSGQMAMPVPSGLAAGSPPPSMPSAGPSRPDDASMGVVRQAQRDRDDILGLLARLPADQRAQVPDVGRSASMLAEKVQALAYSLADLDRSAGSQTAAQLEAEISRLENDANPLDVEASETRVKRLAFLKRQRRGVADVVERRKQIAGKLDTCASALASMKLDLNRLSVGSQTFQNITSLANEAMSLARSVDHVLEAADEVGRLTSDRPQPRPI